MSLKSELSEDRKKKIQEFFYKTEKEIYDEVLVPSFRMVHEKCPMAQCLIVEVTEDNGTVILHRTIPFVEIEKSGLIRPFWNYRGNEFDGAWLTLSSLCSKAKEFELEGNIISYNPIKVRFLLTLDD